MKHAVRAFSIGLFTASAILFVVFYFFHDANAENNMTKAEMEKQLKAQGYRVVSEADYIALSVQKDKKTQQKAASDKKAANETPEQKADSSPKEKKEVKTFTIHIAKGMATSDISQALEDNGIIEDAKEFDAYLEKHDYAQSIQLGKHKLSSNMSTEEIAKTLTE